MSRAYDGFPPLCVCVFFKASILDGNLLWVRAN